MTFLYSQELTDDYERLFDSDERYDVIIYAGKDENMEKLRAHSIILCARSQYFRNALSNQLTIEEDGKFILEISNISPRIFKYILRFIYCGRIDLTNFQGLEILELLTAVEELNIQTLIPCIREYLIDHRLELLLDQDPINILEIVLQLNQYNTFKGIWGYFLETICEKPEILFNPDNLIRLNAPLLELLLKQNDLSLNEIEIWDNLIKWSLAQHPSIQQDVKKWNKEEIEIMKSTVHRFIPLIRFNNISSRDFYFKLYPYKLILTEDLTEDILAFHMMPNKKVINGITIKPLRKSNYDSNIVKSQHFAIFSSWIEKKYDSYYCNQKDIPYHFNLIYRASRDGDDNETFHKKCNNKGATIVIVKIKGTEQIFGGYNPMSWKSRGRGNNIMTVANSFIYSFINRKDIKTAKVDNGLELSYYPGYGPSFGNYLYYSNDAWMINNNFLRNYLDIKVPMTGGYIDTDDYEVFQVIKKP